MRTDKLGAVRPSVRTDKLGAVRPSVRTDKLGAVRPSVRTDKLRAVGQALGWPVLSAERGGKVESCHSPGEPTEEGQREA